jgi:hypothetical protein
MSPTVIFIFSLKEPNGSEIIFVASENSQIRFDDKILSIESYRIICNRTREPNHLTIPCSQNLLISDFEPGRNSHFHRTIIPLRRGGSQGLPEKILEFVEHLQSILVSRIPEDSNRVLRRLVPDFVLVISDLEEDDPLAFFIGFALNEVNHIQYTHYTFSVFWKSSDFGN